MKGPKMSQDPLSDEKQLESLKDLQSVIEGRISRLEGLRKLNVSSSGGFTQQEIKTLENKVIQMFGRQLAIRHRQNDNEINEELEQFPNFQMWLFVMDIHEEAKELLASKLKTLMALVEMPEKEVRSIMKLCKCTEEETRKLLLGLKSVKKVYRAQIQGKNPSSGSVENSDEEVVEVESPPNSPSESSSQSQKHPSSSSLASETDQGFQEPLVPIPHTPPLMIYDDHPSKRYNVTPPSTPTFKKNKPRGTPPPNKKLMSVPPASQLKRSKSSEVSPHKVDMSSSELLISTRKFLNIKSPSHSSSSLDKFQSRRHSEDGTLDRSRRNSHSSPFRNESNRVDSLSVLEPGRKSKTLNNIRRSPRIRSKMAHKITHRFSKKHFLKPLTCDFCHDKLFVKGYKCKDCKYVCHSKCRTSAEGVPSCGLPRTYEEVFKRRYENPEKRAAQISLETLEDNDYENLPSPFLQRRSVPNDAPFSPGESSSNPSSTTSSTPSSPAPYATSSASLTPSSPIHPNIMSVSQFTFPDVPDNASIQSDQVRSINSDVTLTIDSTASHHPFTDSERTLPETGGSIDYASDSGSSDQVLVRKHSNTVSEWDIPYDQLELKELIGEGRFGPVYRGNWHGEVAVKKIAIDEQDKEQLKAFQREVSQFKKTRHENIVLFTGACMHPPDLAIVTTLCKGQTLYTHIHTRKDRFGLIKAMEIATQIAQGLGYLHAKGIVHKDLKSKNIFIENGKVVITDFALFSLARLSREKRKDVLIIPDGWLCYLAPELITALTIHPDNIVTDLPFTEKSDVFAFGTVWFELLTGEWPFQKEPPEAIIWKVGKGLKQPISQIQASRDVKEILMMCWAYYKDSRPSFSHIKKLLQRLPKKRPGLHRSPSHPLHLSRSAESII